MNSDLDSDSDSIKPQLRVAFFCFKYQACLHLFTFITRSGSGRCCIYLRLFTLSGSMRCCIYLLYFTLFGCIYLRLLPDLVPGVVAFIYVNLPNLVTFSFIGSIWVCILLRFIPQLGVAFFPFIYLIFPDVVAVIYVNLPYLVPCVVAFIYVICCTL